MSGTIALKQKDFYGAFELKKLYPRNYTLGLAVAIFFHLILIGFYYFYEAGIKEENIGKITFICNYPDLPQQPINVDITQPIAAAQRSIPLTNGIPVPAPVDQVLADQTIPTQDQLSHQNAANSVPGTGNIKVIVDTKAVEIPEETDPDPGTFYPCEKFPEIVIAATPVYNEIAIRSGITGKVYVKVLVDKEGKPKRAFVVKTDSDLFNQAAIDAAMKSVFTPAIQNHHPIAVWTVLPYRFQLQD